MLSALRSSTTRVSSIRSFSLIASPNVSNPALWELNYAARIRNAFSKGHLLTAADFPAELAAVTSADDMIRIADRLQQLTISDLHMQRIGWKIGATNAKAQQGLGLNSCFVGPCFAETTFDSPANVVATGRHVRGIESEFGFEMKHALMPRGKFGAPYTELDVAKAIRKMIPVIEVVGTRFAPIPAPGKPLPPIALLSDLGGAHAVIKSNHQHKHWQDFALDQVSVQVTVNGQVRAQGTGADVLGHPIKALTWLINYLGARNIIVPKESFIITGTCTGLTPVQPGDKVVVEFSDNIGNIEVQME